MLVFKKWGIISWLGLLLVGCSEEEEAAGEENRWKRL